MPFVPLGCTGKTPCPPCLTFSVESFGGHRHNDTEAGENDLLMQEWSV